MRLARFLLLTASISLFSSAHFNVGLQDAIPQ
jgi:hypothetical protein